LQAYVSISVACVTPSQQRGVCACGRVCASAKVKHWQDEATFVPCKHNPASMLLCQAACVCVRVCVGVCKCVCPTMHQVGVRWRMGAWSRGGGVPAHACKHARNVNVRQCACKCNWHSVQDIEHVLLDSP